MKKSQATTAALLVSILFARGVAAQDAPVAARTKEEAIRELLRVTGAIQLGRQVMDQMMPPLRKMAPDLPDEFWTAFNARIRTEDMTDQIVPIYARYFTAEEVEQLIAFHRSPLGQKVIAATPAIMKECMTVGQEWGRGLAERAMREAETQRSKKTPQP